MKARLEAPFRSLWFVSSPPIRAHPRRVQRGVGQHLSRLPQLFADDPANRVGADRLSRSPKMLSECLIDHRLVPPPRGVGSLAKRYCARGCN